MPFLGFRTRKLLSFVVVWLFCLVPETIANDDDVVVLDNQETCAHRVVNCDPNVDHFETKISMKHSSTVTKLEYHNTYILLEQSWPTRGPWMTETSQRIVLVRCGCPVPTTSLSADWQSNSKVIHIPVSSLMVQMPNSLSKVYLMGQRSKVVAVESNRWISDATPEIATDIRDGRIRLLDRSPNGKPSTRITLSFTRGSFVDATTGFRLQLVDVTNDASPVVVGQTDCIFPASSNTDSSSLDEQTLDEAFNSIPGWVDAGKVWVLTSGEPSEIPSTSLSYTLYFDNQLPMDLTLQGDVNATACNADVDFKIVRDAAPANRPIYHRLHDMPGGFPDVVFTEPRSLGPLSSNDLKIEARRFLDADPGETTLLGRAELVKLTALLVGSVHTGNSLFDLIELRYMNAKKLAAQAKHRPSVMVGKPGTWNEAARSSWMITVGTTYVGQFFRDANVEYRNSDDAVNQAICPQGGCGVCPSGTSDTRCSVPITDYVNLFQSADYWISAGIGANCWSASCNFEMARGSDSLLDENREIYSQFLPMQCGSVIALDKAHGGSGNTYWELGRVRPDLILMDLVTLMHPDLELDQETTTFFRMLPPPTNLTQVPDCPRTWLPEQPGPDTVHVTAGFATQIVVENLPTSEELIGAPHFAVLERFYPTVHTALAKALAVNVQDLEIAMSNEILPPPQERRAAQDGDDSSFGISVTVRVPSCQEHSCGVEVGEKLNTLGPDTMEQALDLPWIKVERDLSRSVLVLDGEGDTIPLEDLVVVAAQQGGNDNTNNNDDDCLSAGAIVGIVLGVLAAFVISLYATYHIARGKGASTATTTEGQDNSRKSTNNADVL